ncbi:putative MFS-type transporter -like protein [Halotydeus destructor]|nr:putative MFS-type transporter -like protein [Halotydeus destructor]
MADSVENMDAERGKKSSEQRSLKAGQVRSSYGPSTTSERTEVTNKRFLILALFCIYSMVNAFQWIQYSIIANIITEYYDVTDYDVNWTSVIYMVVYIPLIFPASWLLDKKGLRFSVILGAFGTCLGAWIKTASVSPDRFWVTMIGQTVAAVSQLFVLNIPPRIAAVWFKTEEASRATSIGVFGNQIGIALGFIIPPNLVDKTSLQTISTGLSTMFIGVAVSTTVILILIVVLFENAPKHPPSLAQASAIESQSDSSFASVLSSLLTNRNYLLMLLTYGLNVGVFYAISTDLNQMVTSRFKDSEESAGLMGLLLTVAGIFGSVICGYALDKTHLFKETTLFIYCFTLVGMIGFTGALRLSTLTPLYFVSFLLGFFMTGYLPIGFEFAAELSYPNPEGTSAGLLNAAAQVFGLVFTFGATYVIKEYSELTANIGLTISLILGVLLTAMIKPDLRRQRAAGTAVNVNEEKEISKF